ncbi:phospholipase D-like domain-containing protein [Sodalis-like secondary symbiont of Drepanosiphum platanoidis]|uniref:phospholipase D-like domain-containing protein n=1 Tax=Sodalis-like secondary symbiont of Drepanosiphum platanoidis TaxID=2994493 RepID=UPI003464199E
MKKIIKYIITIFLIFIIFSNSLFANKLNSNIIIKFSPENKIKKLILSIIRKAKSTIDIAAYNFTNKSIAKELIYAKNRGINIRILLNYNKNFFKNKIILFLLKNKILLKLNNKYSIMHNKFIIIDNKSIETGSLNYTNNALYNNAENIIYLYNNPKIAKKYFYQFNKLWNEGMKVFK